MHNTDFQNCIHKTKKQDNEQNTENMEEEMKLYTVLGEQEFIDKHKLPRTHSEAKALAKEITANGETKYFAKVNSYGKLYNPIGMFSEGKSNKFLSRIGRNEYNFKRITSRTFELYTSFLKSRNIAWINQAEREMN